MWDIKEHYFRSQKEVNPSQVVPVIDFGYSTGRAKAEIRVLDCRRSPFLAK